MIKNLNISEAAVKAITIEAVNEGTVFKLKAELILENYAKPLIAKGKRVKKVKKEV